MREASLKDITKFLQCKRIAVVGVSRDTHHFSRMLFREFVAKGYDVVPVNTAADEIEGRPCFARLWDIKPPVEAVLLMTGTPDATDQMVRECQHAKIRNIWIYKTVSDRKFHEESIDLCRSQGTTVVEGYCPFMFLPHPGIVHRAHGFIMKVTRNYPPTQAARAA